ncbi:hypothetical protein EDD21DRAFT_404857 [Dissophora ornata]|nr:hypothetical protein EDD21DRAFT_404857 [Dissophora ornata]
MSVSDVNLFLLHFPLLPSSQNPSKMATLKPFDLPEISSLVASYLDNPTLACCLRVCRAWHSSFAPLIWKEVRVHVIAGSTPRGPSLEALERHSDLITKLDIVDRRLGLYSMAYPNLHTLKLYCSDNTWPQPNMFAEFKKEMIPINLIEFCPSLVRLELVGIGIHIQSDFWRAVTELHHLKELRLGMANIPSSAVGAFLKSCKWLESLEMNFASIDVSNIDASVTFPRLRRLKLESMFGSGDIDVLLLVNRCPLLRTLFWGPEDAGRWQDYFQEFQRYVGRVDWSRVESLRLQVHILDRDLAIISNEVQRLVELDIYGSFGRYSFKALRRHFATLTLLRVGDKNGIESYMLREILCSCPALEVLGGSVIAMKEILEDRPWVCVSLKRLDVVFQGYESEKHLVQLVNERASTLARLEHYISIHIVVPEP